ncbi:CoA transferase [Glutamicibacter halophytocola]|uniref:CoA transferase n=1 Tax=Glutamicibacter halophytocola TaxID=1933880 RepID=UPI0020A65909|nr:CoA transferase [Glutamicibacter halophytocola]
MRTTDDAGQTTEKILGGGFAESGVLEFPVAVKMQGPRRWWNGPLDVEQLALGSVGLVAAALRSLSAGRLDVGIQSDQVAAAFGSSSLLRINGEQSRGFAEHSGFYRTGDGWIRTHANYPHHEQRLLQSVGASAGGGLRESLAGLSSIQAQELIVASGGVAAAVQTRADWAGSAAGQAAKRGAWAQFTLHEANRSKTWGYAPGANRPLEGLRVLDLTRVIAGPTASRTLAAFGAEVLRVDAPQLPELQAQHVDTGFGKRSSLLDLSSPVDGERMARLLEGADVLITGYRQGALSRFGLDPQSLQEKYPELIIAELDAWGYEGPWASRRGFDSIVQAACGISDAYRTERGEPGALPVQALDHATGYGLAAAVIAMVQARSERRGVGLVRFSLARTAEALFALGAPEIPDKELEDPRTGRMASSYGELEYALTPFLIDGHLLDYRAASPAYGQDEPIWL